MVRNDVNGVGRDRHRAREVDLLPTAGTLVAKGGRGQQGTRSVPQVTHVRTSVLRTFVEPNAYDLAGGRGLKLDAQFYRVGVISRRDGWRIARAEKARGLERWIRTGCKRHFV